MLLPVAHASGEPDPADFADMMGDIERKIDTSSSITEPFAPGFEGKVEPIDLKMREFLGSKATARAFEALNFTVQRMGDIALHYNPATVQWN